MIVPPRPASRARMQAFADPRLSYLRALEYELLTEIHLEGRVLDLGGGHKTDYAKRLSCSGVIEGLNIDTAVEPTYVHDANTRFPIADATYDAAISFNTLEHIRSDEHALGELIRVLKPGATFHIVVPFLYRVHGSPSDYHRHTAFWWEEALARSRVPPEHSRIEPLVWGRFSTAFAFLEFTRLRALRKLPLLLDAVLGSAANGAAEHALGYYISGTKP